MKLNNRRNVVRSANQVVSRLKASVSTALYRGQLGPANESELELLAHRSWHNHRAL